MKRRCDLCGGAARVECESDEARLCFECDGKVHSANFLVARHPRTLLCRRCGGPTPWRASGPVLGPAVSICGGCIATRGKRIEEDEEVNSSVRDFTAEEEEEEDDDEEDEDGEGEGEDEEEQVVPGTADHSPPPPTEMESSSSGGEEVEEDDELATKRRRRRENVTDLVGSPSQDRLPCSSTFHTAGDDEVASNSFPPLKYRKKSGGVRSDAHRFSSDLMLFGSSFPPI